jgi:hypothetical protein
MTRHLTRHLRPTATKNLVVYSKATGERRRVIDADDDGEYAWHEERLHPGEGMVYLDHATYDGFPHAHALNDHVAQHAGFAKAPDPMASRHAVVHPDGHVVNFIHADPTCGDSGEHIGPGHVLVQHPEAGFDWRLVKGVLTPPHKEGWLGRSWHWLVG